MDAGDFECLCINLIELVACIIARQRCDGRTNEPHGQWSVVIDVRCVSEAGAIQATLVVIVEDLQLVLMCMTEEDASDGVGSEPGDNRVEERCGVGKSVGTIIAGEDVTDDPSTLIFLFTGFKFLDEIFENARLVRIGEVEKVEHIVFVPLENVSEDSCIRKIILTKSVLIEMIRSPSAVVCAYAP